MSGCADSATDDYRTYSELTSEAGEAGPADEAAADRSELPTSAAVEAEPTAVASAPVDEPDTAVAQERIEPVAAPRPQVAPQASETGSEESLAVAVADETKADQPEPAATREVKLLVENREFKTEGPQDALRISYDDFDLLKILNMEPVTTNAPNLLPDWLKDLDGQRVRVRGFMYPPFQETGIVVFVLARDNQICCFGRNPKVYDLVKVTMRKGTSTDYIQNRPFDVVGVFHIRPQVDEDTLVSLYEMDDAIVID